MFINQEVMNYLCLISLMIIIVEIILTLIFFSVCLIVAILKCYRRNENENFNSIPPIPYENPNQNFQ